MVARGRDRVDLDRIASVVVPDLVRPVEHVEGRERARRKEKEDRGRGVSRDSGSERQHLVGAKRLAKEAPLRMRTQTQQIDDALDAGVHLRFPASAGSPAV